VSPLAVAPTLLALLDVPAPPTMTALPLSDWLAPELQTAGVSI
jgi:hypothetical protein